MTIQIASPTRIVCLAPQLAGEPAEEQGAAEGDELHQQDGARSAPSVPNAELFTP